MMFAKSSLTLSCRSKCDFDCKVKATGFRVSAGALVALSALFLPVDCYAYIDPNAGGWLFQMLFPVFIAIGGIWTAFRQRISMLFSRLLGMAKKYFRKKV